MSRRDRFGRAVERIERRVDALRGRRDTGRPVVDAHVGYAAPEGWVLRGRVLVRLRPLAEDAPSRLGRMRHMAGLFLTEELPGERVVATASGVAAVTDAEGYFRLVVPPGRAEQGWGRVAVRVGRGDARAILPVRVPGPEARRIVVSDIDDTVMRTGAWSTARNLWTTMTGSVARREVLADSVGLLQGLAAGGRDPVCYVSSSPWNLHGFLQEVMRRAGLPEGPMFLRDYGFGPGQFVTGTHGDHKGASIDTILAANPDLPAVLVGDTGQHDAAIYADAAARHPGRVERVILREAAGRPVPQVAAARLAGLGVPVHVAADLTGAMDGQG